MREFLAAPIKGSFQLSQLCGFASKSESQTIKIFKKAFDVTHYNYFCSKKTELTKNMLTNTNLSVNHIAYNLHFAHEYYFSNSFKQFVGKSPSSYKKKPD